MDPLTIAAIIGAGASLGGGFLGQQTQQGIAAQNIQQQLMYAQHGLTMRAKDATHAQDVTGINRLALLGVPTSSFSNIAGDNSLGSGVAAAGQDISRALAAVGSRNDRLAQLEEQLTAAKIANVNADTTRMLAAASQATRAGQPGSPPVPLPPMRWIEGSSGSSEIPLVQKAYDPRTGEGVFIPSEKAASPLQTIAAAPVNISMAARSATEGLGGYDNTSYNWLPLRSDAWRGVDMRQYVPF